MNTAVATIISCNPSLRRLEGQIKDGAPISIVVWETPGLFVWPKLGEQWTVMRSIGVWKLGQRIESAEEHSIEDLQPGDGKIAATRLVNAEGKTFALGSLEIAGPFEVETTEIDPNEEATVFAYHGLGWVPQQVWGSMEDHFWSGQLTWRVDSFDDEFVYLNFLNRTTTDNIASGVFKFSLVRYL